MDENKMSKQEAKASIEELGNMADFFQKEQEDIIRKTLQVLRKENYDIPYTPTEIIKKIKDYSFL